MVDVPCNGCRACCVNERIILSAEDDPAQYSAVPTRKGDGPVEWMLEHKPNGECIYLTNTGCSIHERAPRACREFDCRAWLRGFGEAIDAVIVQSDPMDDGVIGAALKLMSPAERIKSVFFPQPHQSK